MFKNLFVVSTAALAMSAAASLPAAAFDGTDGPEPVAVPEPTSILAIVVGGAVAAHAASKSKND